MDIPIEHIIHISKEYYTNSKNLPYTGIYVTHEGETTEKVDLIDTTITDDVDDNSLVDHTGEEEAILETINRGVSDGDIPRLRARRAR